MRLGKRPTPLKSKQGSPPRSRKEETKSKSSHQLPKNLHSVTSTVFSFALSKPLSIVSLKTELNSPLVTIPCPRQLILVPELLVSSHAFVASSGSLVLTTGSESPRPRVWSVRFLQLPVEKIPSSKISNRSSDSLWCPRWCGYCASCLVLLARQRISRRMAILACSSWYFP